MKQVFFHKTYLSYKEKKVPPGSFFSFFACMAAVFFLTGCFRENAAESKMPSLEEKNIRRVKKMEDMRLLRLLLVEKEKHILARRVLEAAGEQLGLQVRVTATPQENVMPLLRSDRADLAYGVELDRKALARSRLEGYTLRFTGKKAGEQSFFFLMPPGSGELWGFLEKAALSAAANGRIDFALSAEDMKKMSVSEKPEEVKKENIKKDIFPQTAEKVGKSTLKNPSGEGKRSGRGKLKKRERIRAKIRQNLEKMKNLQKEK